ncbi:MAG: TIGR00725 family protein [bacterium]
MVHIGVIGAGRNEDKTNLMALEVGREVARAGAVLICGGLGGVMESAARGAREEKGTTVGILPGETRDEANPYIDIPIPTDLGHARNAIVVRASDALIAVGGGYGTLSEIALALKMGKPVAGLDTWEIRGIHAASHAKEAVRTVLDLLKK